MERRKITYHEEVKRSKRIFLLKAVIAFVSILFFTSAILYLLFLSPVFRIHSILVSGVKYVNAKSVNSFYSSLEGGNILTTHIDPSQIEKKYPLIQNIVLSKNLPDQIVLQVQEYPPFALVQTQSLTYVSTYNGIVIDKVPNSSTKYSLPLLVSTESDVSKLPLGQLMIYIDKLEKDKKEFIGTFQFDYPYKITVTYSDGHQVYLSLNKSIDDQVAQINKVKQEIGFSKCMKLDVRFDNLYCSN